MIDQVLNLKDAIGENEAIGGSNRGSPRIIDQGLELILVSLDKNGGLDAAGLAGFAPPLKPSPKTIVISPNGVLERGGTSAEPSSKVLREGKRVEMLANPKGTRNAVDKEGGLIGWRKAVEVRAGRAVTASEELGILGQHPVVKAGKAVIVERTSEKDHPLNGVVATALPPDRVKLEVIEGLGDRLADLLGSKASKTTSGEGPEVGAVLSPGGAVKGLVKLVDDIGRAGNEGERSSANDDLFDTKGVV
jgi:hypothetical protein